MIALAERRRPKKHPRTPDAPDIRQILSSMYLRLVAVGLTTGKLAKLLKVSSATDIPLPMLRHVRRLACAPSAGWVAWYNDRTLSDVKAAYLADLVAYLVERGDA